MINILHIVIPSNIGYFISWVHDFTVYIYIYTNRIGYIMFFSAVNTPNSIQPTVGISVDFPLGLQWASVQGGGCLGRRRAPESERTAPEWMCLGWEFTSKKWKFNEA